jgi:hypothetical protein
MPTAIIDFSYLRASERNALKTDLRGYTVLLTFELMYEISTNSDGVNPCDYCKRLAGLNLVHSRSLINLVKEEVGTSRRAHNVLHPNSEQLVDAVINARGIDAEQGVRDFFERGEPQEFKNALDRLWNDKYTSTFSGYRSVDLRTDATKYLEMFAALGSKGFGERIAKYHHMKQTPQPGWLIYEWERLRNFLAFRYRVNGTRSDQLCNDKKLANNLADLTYLAFASRVDAVATNDKTLILPLAQVFGPPTLRIIEPHQKSG